MRESPALVDPASLVWDAVDAAAGDGDPWLTSITSGARALARFIAGFFAAGAVEGSDQR